MTRFIDDDSGDRAERGAGRRESRIPHPGPLEAGAPWPVDLGQQLLPRHSAPVGQPEDVGALALHDRRPALVARHVRQPLRVAKPAIGDDQGRRPHQSQPLQRGPGPIQHHLQPRQRVAAGPPGTPRVWTPHREVHRDDQLPFTEHHHQQQPIDAEPDAMFLATIPGAD
jgi:hypothetical protein